jgi:hypothetical protein
MTTIHDSGSGQNGIAPTVKFQALTIFVCASAIALLIASVKRWRGGQHDVFILAMPAIHVVPWCFALMERKRVQRLRTIAPQDQSLIQTAIANISWAGYIALAAFEYWLY